jgi:hypothetical protein
MKKIYFVLLFCAVTCISFAQLKVASTGKVGINIGTSAPLSNLSVNSVGNSAASLWVTGATYGIYAERSGTTGSTWVQSIVGTAPVAANRFNIGLQGTSILTNPVGTGRAWGVFGLAGNSTTGCNYGVFGSTYGSQNGAGIVGTINNNQDVFISGIYAGYFVGNVKVTGLINGVTVGDSDNRLKQNITGLDDAANSPAGASTLDKVLQMKPVEYNLKQQYTESTGDSATVQRALYDENSQLFQKKHYGLIAQDLQELYPDLVYKSDNGYLSINYTGIIPLLIQSIKELKAEVQTLENDCCNSNNSLKSGSLEGNTSNSDLTGAKLYQNTPNPFSVQTTIRFEIPETVQSAQLHICNMTGTLLKTITINQRGSDNVIINANEFVAGMYLYSLVCDGKIIDTKQMLLTK